VQDEDPQDDGRDRRQEGDEGDVGGAGGREPTFAGVTHCRDEYVSNQDRTVEGFYSIFKPGMKGDYKHCSKKHLHRYAAFDFRYSNRVGLDVDDQARAVLALQGVVGKRHTYRRPDERAEGRA
jgi:hypothetical protein